MDIVIRCSSDCFGVAELARRCGEGRKDFQQAYDMPKSASIAYAAIYVAKEILNIPVRILVDGPFGTPSEVNNSFETARQYLICGSFRISSNTKWE